jgi:putative membrane protein
LRLAPGQLQTMHLTIDPRTLPTAQFRAFAALAAMLALAQIGQPFPEVAWLHHVPTLLLLICAPTLLRRWPLSDGAMVALALFFALHTLGGRYTYSSVPYDEWARALTGGSLSDWFGWTRNHYDRLVHFAFGLLFYAPVREIAHRHFGLSLRLAAIFSIGFVLSVGALYEMFEGLLTLTVAPEVADDYNGQQGDMWDAQKDMGLAFVGALLAAAWIRWRAR